MFSISRKHFMVIALGCGLAVALTGCNSGSRGSGTASGTTAPGGSTTPGTTPGTNPGTTPGTNPTPTLSVTTTTLPSATVGVLFNEAVSATGGTTPYTWSIATGSLPAGIGIDAATGVISGTPAVPANAIFTVRCTDAAAVTADQSLNLVVIAVTTNGAGTWEDLNTVQLPTPSAAFASVAVANKIYIIGGLVAAQGSTGVQPSDAIIEYNPDAGTVFQKNARLPIALAYLDAVAVGGRIFIIGGSDSSGIYPSTFVYDPASDSISTLADMPDLRDSIAVAAVGTDIFAFGGSNFDLNFLEVAPTQTIFKYDTLTNVWTTLAVQLPRVTQWAEALSFNGKIYLIGGGDFRVDMLTASQTTFFNYSAVLEFDPATNQLTQKSSMPFPSKMLVGDVIGNKLYVASGERTTGLHSNPAPWASPVNETYAYDPAADLWETLSTFETNVPGVGAFGGRALSGAAAVNGQLFLMGGFSLPQPGMTTPPAPTQLGIHALISRFTP